MNFTNYLQEKAIYRLLISPSKIVKDDVARYKKHLANLIGTYPSMYSQAHLTLAGFVMLPKYEKALIHSLQLAAAEEKEISLSINGFATFPSSYTVFLNVIEKAEFETLSRNLFRKSRIALLPGTDKTITTMPHLTIARNLASKFTRSDDLFANYQYDQTFTASAALLFREDENGKYTFIQEFPFLAKPAAQLSIF